MHAIWEMALARCTCLLNQIRNGSLQCGYSWQAVARLDTHRGRLLFQSQAYSTLDSQYCCRISSLDCWDHCRCSVWQRLAENDTLGNMSEQKMTPWACLCLVEQVKSKTSQSGEPCRVVTPDSKLLHGLHHRRGCCLYLWICLIVCSGLAVPAHSLPQSCGSWSQHCGADPHLEEEVEVKVTWRARIPSFDCLKQPHSRVCSAFILDTEHYHEIMMSWSFCKRSFFKCL